jgi:hypothetical protein
MEPGDELYIEPKHESSQTLENTAANIEEIAEVAAEEGVKKIRNLLKKHISDEAMEEVAKIIQELVENAENEVIKKVPTGHDDGEDENEGIEIKDDCDKTPCTAEGGVCKLIDSLEKQKTYLATHLNALEKHLTSLRDERSTDDDCEGKEGETPTCDKVCKSIKEVESVIKDLREYIETLEEKLTALTGNLNQEADTQPDANVAGHGESLVLNDNNDLDNGPDASGNTNHNSSGNTEDNSSADNTSVSDASVEPNNTLADVPVKHNSSKHPQETEVEEGDNNDDNRRRKHRRRKHRRSL